MEKSEEKMYEESMDFAVSMLYIIHKYAPTIKGQLVCMASLEVVLYANLLLNGFPEEKLQEYLDRNHKGMMDAIKMYIRQTNARK